MKGDKLINEYVEQLAKVIPSDEAVKKAHFMVREKEVKEENVLIEKAEETDLGLHKNKSNTMKYPGLIAASVLVVIVSLSILASDVLFSLKPRNALVDSMSSLGIEEDVINMINVYENKVVANSKNTLKFYLVGREYLRQISEGKGDKEFLSEFVEHGMTEYVVESEGVLKLYYIKDQKVSSRKHGFADEKEEQEMYIWCKGILNLYNKPILKVNGKDYRVDNVYCFYGLSVHAPLIVSYDTSKGFIYAVYSSVRNEASAFLNQKELVEYAKDLVEKWDKNNYDKNGEPIAG